MRAVVLLPDENHKRSDWSGAFHPEALTFARTHGIPDQNVVQIDIPKPKAHMRRQCVEAIRKAAQGGALDVVAFFCHGWKTGLQLGWDLRTARELAAVIAECGQPYVDVVLYACDAGRDTDGQRKDDLKVGPGGDGGFADRLRDELCRAGRTYCRVYAHVTAGHTTRNPWVRVFPGNGSSVGGMGGHFLVPPKTPLWGPWKAALRGDLRFWFPVMHVEEVHRELAGDPACREAA